MISGDWRQIRIEARQEIYHIKDGFYSSGYKIYATVGLQQIAEYFYHFKAKNFNVICLIADVKGKTTAKVG